ncbi:MAG: ATP synthase subunit I [Brooklawnia sp.]|jgi:F1F0 ATPase subunit 2
MNQLFTLALLLLAGAGLGLVYFGGLWLVVRRLAQWRHPGLVMLASLVVRTTVVVLGFWVLLDGQWQRAVAMLIGFVLARIVFARRVRPQDVPAPASQEARP